MTITPSLSELVGAMLARAKHLEDWFAEGHDARTDSDLLRKAASRLMAQGGLSKEPLQPSASLEVRNAAIEECAKIVCGGCARGWRIEFDRHQTTPGSSMPCTAHRIRALLQARSAAPAPQPINELEKALKTPQNVPITAPVDTKVHGNSR